MVRFIPALAAAGLFAFAAPASAQLVNRAAKEPAKDAPAKDAAATKDGKEAAKDAKKASDDDDILAPEGGAKAKDTPADAGKPKSYAVGLVGIVPLGDAGKSTADTATAGLQKELGAGHVFDVNALAVDVKGAAAGPGADEAAAKQALADGKTAFDKAQKLLDNTKMGAAKKGFEQAVELFEKAAPALADPEPLVVAHMRLAEVAARSGDDAGAEKELLAAAALNPERALDKTKFPGAFISTYDKLRQKLMKEMKHGSVVVDATGAGSNVEIDGRATAGAPVTVTELPAGKHVVRAVREGLPAYGVVVDVKEGETVTVSPGFIAKDGKGIVDDLQNNRLGPDAAKSVADAAKAANEKGAVVGVVNKTSTGVEVQLVLVDAGGAGFVKLPSLAFTGDMLDIGIETLKARDAIEAAFDKPAWTSAALAQLVEGAAAGAGVRMATMAMRYDVQIAKASSRSRLVTDDGKKGGDDGLVASRGLDDEGGKTILNAGKSGTRARLDDEDDPYASKKDDKKDIPDPDAPLTEQGWFWPTVIGGGAGAVVLLGVGSYFGLVAGKVLPDPRPTAGGEVHVAIP